MSASTTFETRGISLWRAGILLAAALSLVGCASMRGSQRRLTSADSAAFVSVCPSVAQINAKPSSESEGAYRDGIIMVCVKAINARYDDFVEDLSQESTATNLVTEVGSQTLGVAASVVTKEAVSRKLAAGSALLLGIGGAVNKDLFYKQTLPAIVASMDARRAYVLTDIVNQQNADPEARIYKLTRAGMDLDRYQAAGSLLNAVRELTLVAVQNAAEAEAVLQNAQRSLDLGPFNAATPTSIRTRATAAAVLVRTLETPQSEAKLRTIAVAFKVDKDLPAGSSAVLMGARIRAEIGKVATLPIDQQEARMKEIEIILAPYSGAPK